MIAVLAAALWKKTYLKSSLKSGYCLAKTRKRIKSLLLAAVLLAVGVVLLLCFGYELLKTGERNFEDYAMLILSLPADLFCFGLGIYEG